MKPKRALTCLGLIMALLTSLEQSSGFAPGLEDVTEVISVVRIGVSLVEYTYKVFSAILKDSGAGEVTRPEFLIPISDNPLRLALVRPSVNC